MAKLAPMMLVVIALVLLVLPGILYNNMAASGLVPGVSPAPAFAFTCPGNGDVTCQNNAGGGNYAGCQAAASQCTLNGVSISFLNQASPFTQLINGNIEGFFTGLTNAGNGLQGGRGPFDMLGGTFITVNCEVTQNIDGHQTNAAIPSCTQTNLDQSNITLANAATWVNWNTNQNGTVALSQQFFNLPHTAPGTQMTCSEINQINFTTIANGPGWTYFGCDLSAGPHVITNQIWSFLVAMPVSGGGIAAGTHHWYLFAQLENVDFDGAIPPTSQFYSIKYENFRDSFKGILVSGNAFSSQYFLPGINGPVIGFLFGFVLLIIGIGMNFTINGTFWGTGGGFGTGINQQGTRLAQSLGIGLIVFSPMFSEFSLWFTSSQLPYGLDGSTGIISFIIDGLFFVGVAWTALSTSSS